MSTADQRYEYERRTTSDPSSVRFIALVLTVAFVVVLAAFVAVLAVFM